MILPIAKHANYFINKQKIKRAHQQIIQPDSTSGGEGGAPSLYWRLSLGDGALGRGSRSLNPLRYTACKINRRLSLPHEQEAHDHHSADHWQGHDLRPY